MHEGKLFWYIMAATIPAGVLGLLLDKLIGFLIGDNLNVEMLKTIKASLG